MKVPLNGTLWEILYNSNLQWSHNISKHIVDDVMEKNFDGKNEIISQSKKVLKTDTKRNDSNGEIEVKNKVTSKKVEPIKSKSSNDDEWESF